MPFGKTDFAEGDLAANLAALTACIEKNRPVGCKGRRRDALPIAHRPRRQRVPPLAERVCVSLPRGRLWKTATLCSTMGPPLKLDINALRAFATEGEAAAA